MLLIIYGFIVELFCLGMVKNLINDWELASLFFIGINIFFVIFGIGLTTKKNFLILCFAYIIRLVAMLWDIYGRNVFMLIGSGGDSEGFLKTTVSISKDLNQLSGYTYGGLYTKILGIISYISFPERLLLQYINVILGLFVILITYKTLKILNVDSKIVKHILIFMTFFPISIIHSAILLRENAISFFVILSFYFFIKWFNEKKLYNVIFSISMLGIASIFHSGVIGFAAGYIFALLLYNHRKDRLTFDTKTVIWFTIIFIFGAVIFTQYSSVFLGKFNKVKNLNDIMKIASSGRGGAQYLKWLKITNITQLILFTPIKMLYFLASPLPTDWRGLGDITAFLIDGSFYLYLIVFCFGKLFNKSNRDPLIVIITAMTLGVIFIFGIGLNNAGTAMRHRNKIMPILIVLCALIKDKQIKLKTDINF